MAAIDCHALGTGPLWVVADVEGEDVEGPVLLIVQPPTCGGFGMCRENIVLGIVGFHGTMTSPVSPVPLHSRDLMLRVVSDGCNDEVGAVAVEAVPFKGHHCGSWCRIRCLRCRALAGLRFGTVTGLAGAVLAWISGSIFAVGAAAILREQAGSVLNGLVGSLLGISSGCAVPSMSQSHTAEENHHPHEALFSAMEMRHFINVGSSGMPRGSSGEVGVPMCAPAVCSVGPVQPHCEPAR